MREILCVVRWPVGGIRTYLQRLVMDEAFRHMRFRMVLPDIEESQVLRQQLSSANVEWLWSGNSSRSLATTLLRTIIRSRPPLVHSHGFTSALCSSLICAPMRIPHLVTAHDVFQAAQFTGGAGLLRRGAMRAALGAVNAIHFVTDDARQNVFQFIPGLSSARAKTLVVPHGVDIVKLEAAKPWNLRSTLGLRDSIRLIGFCGRFMAQKGFRILVDAATLLEARRRELPDFKIVAVGSGGYVREDRQYVADRGLQQLFHFEPLQPDIGPVLKGLDMLVMPSRWEASGLLAMEALVIGVPLIGTTCVGLRETLEETPARKVAPEDPRALAAAIADELTQSTRQRALAFVADARKRFDQRVAYRALRQVYGELGID